MNAKNSLQIVAGFSPFQLVLGFNPKLPATLSDELPARSIKPSSQIGQENLNAIHSACAAFIASENSERILRALLHNVQTSSEVKYITGDTVLYKHHDSNEWRGPCIVIGQINQQVFVEHSSFCVRVHPCRLQLVKPASRAAERNDPSIEKIDKNNTTRNHNKYHYETSSDSENYNENHSSDSEDESQERNQQSHLSPSTPNSYLQPTETNHPRLTTSSDSTEIKHQQASSLEHPRISPKKIKPNMQIRYKVSENDPWEKAQITSRAGKATGKNYSWWNIINQDGSKQAIDLKAINSWEISDSPSNSNSELVEKNPETTYENMEQSNDEKTIDEVSLLS